MIYPFGLGRSVCIFFFTLVLMGGCVGTNKNTRFYALNSVGIQNNLQRSDSIDQGLSIGVGPVEIPDYLDRPHIVTRTGQNELDVDYFNLWVGSLKDNIARVLAENLTSLLSTENVSVFPSRQSFRSDYRVAVDVIRFDGSLGGRVLLKANWSVFENKGDKILIKNLSHFQRQTDRNSFQALVAAQSQLLVDLSREIANAIQTVHGEAKKKPDDA